MSTHPKITIYYYYGNAIYLGNDLALYRSGPIGIDDILKILGIPFEFRSVRWEDWPGVEKDSSKVYDPPKHLHIVEAHFAKNEENRKRRELHQARLDVMRLEAELKVVRPASSSLPS